MSYRLRKQLFIVTLILFIIALILVGIYFVYIREPATCFDGKQNQGEEGIDCGGPCDFACERLTIREVVVNWTKFLNLGNGQYDLIAQINNSNPNYGVDSLNYTFKIYDSTGNLLKEYSGKSFVLPSQQKYIIEGGVSIPQPFSQAELVIEPTPQKDWKKINEEYRLPNIYVLNRDFSALSSPPGASQITGLIKNDSAFDFDKIIVSIVLFDENKQIMGVNKTEARTVLAGEERYFNALWFSPLNEDKINLIEIQTDTNALSDNNFMRKYGAPEKFQEY